MTKEQHDKLIKRIDEYIDMGHFRRPDEARPYLIDGARIGFGQRDEEIKKILKYCKPYMDQMWAATIVGIILDCDFKEAKTKLIEQGE